jgi:hypothetical protein
MDYSKQSIKDLISICKANGIKGYSGMKQAEIANLVKVNLPETNTIQADPQAQPEQKPNEQTNEELLQAVLKTQTIKKTATQLNLATGTVQRWLELKNVPPQYRFDLFRLLNQEVDYSKYSSNEKDQFFTPTSLVDKCWSTFLEKTKINPKDYIFIEPSAGDGSFLKALPKNSLAFDVEPRHPSVKKQDYLTWHPTQNTSKTKDQKYIVFGNPPFGLRGHVALHFINHSAPFADYVCFILPQLFESDGKGSPRKRVKGYNLIHSEKVGALFYTPERADVTVNGVFQIWSKHTNDPTYTLDKSVSNLVKVYSLSDGGTPSSTRNKEMLDKCDIYLPSTCFGKENMRLYTSFKELPKKGYGVVFLKDKDKLLEKAKKVDWSAVAFLSTNSMFNLRTSIITATMSQASGTS